MAFVVGYLIGSIPFGYIYGKIKGVDVREIGFKRIGASNIYKTFGFIPGVLVFFGDFLKPVLAILIGKAMSGSELTSYIAGIFAIIGHSWPIWLKFKGEGRGLASSLGFLYFLAPRETIIMFVVLFPVGIWLKSTPLLTFVFFCITPFITLLFREPIQFFGLCLSISILAFITRIVKGAKEIRASKNKREIVFNLLLYDNPNGRVVSTTGVGDSPLHE